VAVVLPPLLSQADPAPVIQIQTYCLHWVLWVKLYHSFDPEEMFLSGYLNRVIVNENQLFVITGPERYYLAA
ncbi:hypothetical protein, partial [Citrobacter freundii]|uniref:hypothetical protein n=1 Tax=Citrobacter freundii TaxID=546 RepID=UPI001CB7567B